MQNPVHLDLCSLWLAGDQMLLFEGASQSLDAGNLCPSVKVLGGGTYWEAFGL